MVLLGLAPFEDFADADSGKGVILLHDGLGLQSLVPDAVVAD